LLPLPFSNNWLQVNRERNNIQQQQKDLVLLSRWKLFGIRKGNGIEIKFVNSFFLPFFMLLPFFSAFIRHERKKIENQSSEKHYIKSLTLPFPSTAMAWPPLDL